MFPFDGVFADLNDEVGLIADLSSPMRLPMAESSQVAEYLAMARASSLPTLEPFEGLLTPLARETTLIAVVGRLDPRSLRVMSNVHPRGRSGQALAVLLDTDSWTRPPGTAVPHDPDAYDVAGIARVLRAAGWTGEPHACGPTCPVRGYRSSP